MLGSQTAWLPVVPPVRLGQMAGSWTSRSSSLAMSMTARDCRRTMQQERRRLLGWFVRRLPGTGLPDGSVVVSPTMRRVWLALFDGRWSSSGSSSRCQRASGTTPRSIWVTGITRCDDVCKGDESRDGSRAASDGAEVLCRGSTTACIDGS